MTRKQRLPSPALLAALLVCLLAVGLVSPAEAQQVPTRQQIERAMWTQLEVLMLGVLDGDDERIDSATCLADLLAFQLRREEALGLIVDAGDPQLVQARRQALRDAVSSFVKDLLERGGELEAIDVQRIETYVEAAESLEGEGSQALPIEAAGLLTLELAKLERPVDLNVYLLGERWCLDPLALPGS